jgi:hypothetical protein
MARQGSRAGASPGEEADPRFEPVADAFAGVIGFSLMESKSRATRGLMLDGKSFGMSSHGRLILKLTDQRAGELVSEGVGRPFYPSPERPLKGWIEVTDPEADWVALAQEAYRIATVRGAKKPATKSEGASD